MKKASSQRSPSPSNVAPRRSPSPSNVATRRSPSHSNVATRRSPSPSNVAPRRSPSPKVAPRRNPSPSNVASRRSPSPKVAPRRNPSRSSSNAVAKLGSPSPKVALRRSPSPKVALRRSPSPKVALRRSPSPKGVMRRNPSKVAKVNDPYSTPFWPPSDYSVPAKIVTNDPNPLPRTLAKHKLFLAELKNVLINEKIIDRDNPQFKELLADQQKWNHLFYNLKPYNIICFVICDYHLYDKYAPRVFHKNNEEPYFGNYKFKKLLKYNRMSMKWVGNNILYIHKNRF